MLERFLERISISIYKDNFILKGEMLNSAMLGIDSRTAIDYVFKNKVIYLKGEIIFNG